MIYDILGFNHVSKTKSSANNTIALFLFIIAGSFIF